MSFNRYLDEGLEREHKIEFKDPDERQMEDLRVAIQTAANVLGVEESIEIPVPERGFLTMPLIDEQRRCINHNLGPRYAAQNAAQQAELMNAPIQECKDPMVSLEKLKQTHQINIAFSDKDFESVCSVESQKRIWWIRQNAAFSFLKACSAFNMIGIQPYLEDGFRPEYVQQGLFLRRVVRSAQIHDDWDNEQIKSFSRSLTASTPALAGHQAGAALDMRLRKLETEKFLPLGNGYPDGGVISNINCPYVTQEEYATRMKFACVMRMANFKLLPTENWHASYGDRGMGIDGSAKVMSAVYGPIRSFDVHNDGKVQLYEEVDIMKPYFSDEDLDRLIGLARQKSGDGWMWTETEAVGLFRNYLQTGTWSNITALSSRYAEDASPVQEERDDE